MKEILKSMLSDEKGNWSSKRFVGILCALSLCVTLFISSFSKRTITPPDKIVDCVTILAIGGLGLTTIDKIWSKKEDKNV